MKSRTTMWLFIFAGILWVLVALRDVFAPGFFSFSGRVVRPNNIIFEFAAGVAFFAIGIFTASNRRHLKEKS